MKEEIFSFRRFLLVLRRDVMVNWKNYLTWLSVIYGVLFFGLFLMLVFSNGESRTFGTLSASFAFWFSLVSGFCYLFAASRMLRPLADKPGGISMLTLPASNLEKFLVRVLCATAGCFVTVYVALLACSLTYYPLAAVFGLGDSFYGSLLTDAHIFVFPKFNAVVNGRAYSAALLLWGLVLWQHSLFVYGAGRWRRHPFAKSFGVMVLAFFAGLWLIYILMSQPAVREFLKTEEGVAVAKWSITAVLYLWTVWNWISCWRRFSRAQIVEVKRRRP